MGLSSSIVSLIPEYAGFNQLKASTSNCEIQRIVVCVTCVIFSEDFSVKKIRIFKYANIPSNEFVIALRFVLNSTFSTFNGRIYG